MIIEWVDKKSCLTSGVKKYKAGDIIPSGVLSASRIDYFLSKKKIKVVSEKAVEPEKTVVEPESQKKILQWSDMSGTEQSEYVETVSIIEELENLVKDENTKARVKPVIGKKISELKKLESE